MIVSAFICGPGDHVWLPHKFRVLSRLVDRTFVLFDRCPQGPAIAAKWPHVEWREDASRPETLGTARDGPTFDEGRLRQAVWDWATECRPDYVLLGDADEVPAPEAAGWLAGLQDDGTDVWYADWVNLCHDASRAIGGPSCAWSYQNPSTNKKGMLVKYRPGAEYRYRQGTRHIRMEPSPLNEAATAYDQTHKLGPVPLVHYQWANWQRWTNSARSKLPYFQPWPPPDAQIADVPRSMLWQWDADQLIAQMPEPVAVVGNGPICEKGREIDSHPSIIRFNNWRTDVFEPNVGARTTAWCTNCWEDVKRRPWAGDMFSVTTDGCQYERHSAWLGTYPHMAKPTKSWAEPCREIQWANPSTGLILLHRLAAIGKRVDAYGFSGMVGGHYWNPSDVSADHHNETAAITKLSGRIRFR